MTLREAIEQAINLGHVDPSAIADYVLLAHGEQIALTEMDVPQFVRDRARQVIGAQRRSTIRALTQENGASLLTSVWLPGLGWVALGEMTAADFDAAAATARQAASKILFYADWYEARAAQIRAEGVEFYRELKGEIPALQPARAA